MYLSSVFIQIIVQCCLCYVVLLFLLLLIFFFFFYITDHNFGRKCSKINNLAEYWIMSWYLFHFLYYTSLHPEISGSYKSVYRLPNQAGLAAPFKWHYCSLITFTATATENLRGRWKISIRKKNSTHENRCLGLDYWKQTGTFAGNKGNV